MVVSSDRMLFLILGSRRRHYGYQTTQPAESNNEYEFNPSLDAGYHGEENDQVS